MSRTVNDLEQFIFQSKLIIINYFLLKMKRTLTRDAFKEIVVLCSFLSNLPLNPETQTNLNSLVLIFQFQGRNFRMFFLQMSYVLYRANVYHVSYHLGQLTNQKRRICTHPRHSSKTYSTSMVMNIF